MDILLTGRSSSASTWSRASTLAQRHEADNWEKYGFRKENAGGAQDAASAMKLM